MQEAYRDYVDPKLTIALERAAELLLRHSGEWQSVLDAYWLIRRHEDEIGFPLTYNMVEEVVERVRRIAARGGEALAAEA